MHCRPQPPSPDSNSQLHFSVLDISYAALYNGHKAYIFLDNKYPTYPLYGGVKQTDPFSVSSL